MAKTHAGKQYASLDTNHHNLGGVASHHASNRVATSTICIAGCTVALVVLLSVCCSQTIQRNTNVSAYTRVNNNVLTAPDTIVFVAYGQSNADCCGAPGYTVKHPANVLQYFDGDVYQMKEPMLGAYCRGGCMWSRVGDMLVDAHRLQHDNKSINIVFAATALPGAAIEDLVPLSTAAGRYFEVVAKQLPTATVLFQQGETDAIRRTPPDAYRDMLATIAAVAPSGRIRVGVGTRCADSPPYPPIARVQREYGNGPDLDVLGDAFRRPDRCHFSTLGLAKAAELWTAALVNVHNFSTRVIIYSGTH